MTPPQPQPPNRAHARTQTRKHTHTQTHARSQLHQLTNLCCKEVFDHRLMHAQTHKCAHKSHLHPLTNHAARRCSINQDGAFLWWNIDTVEHRHSGTKTRWNMDTVELSTVGTTTRWNLDTVKQRHGGTTYCFLCYYKLFQVVNQQFC